MTATIDAPAEIEAGDQRPLSARLWAPASVELAHVNLQVTAGGGAALASSLSVSGATIGAGSALSLPGAVQGVTAGPGWLQLDATAVAQRGDAPAPVSQRYALAIRSGPAPALSVPSLPAIVEVGVPLTVTVDARNDGDVDLADAQLAVAATDGSVSDPPASISIAAGASVQQTFSVTPLTAGAPVRLNVALSGASALSGRSFAAQPASASSGAARRPAALAMTASPSQSRASKGQKIPLSVVLTNTGDVDVAAAILSVAAGGSGLVIGPSGAPASSAQLPPTSVPAGRSVTLSPVTVGHSAAPAAFSTFLSGGDFRSGAQGGASTAAWLDLPAGPPTSRSGSRPARMVSGQSATLDVLVRNDGDVDAVSVSAAAQVSGGISAGSPSPASVARLAAAGGSLTFSIPVHAGGPAGTAGISVTAFAQDGNGAGTVSASSGLGLVVHDPPRITASFTGSLPATATEGQGLPATLHLGAP